MTAPFHGTEDHGTSPSSRFSKSYLIVGLTLSLATIIYAIAIAPKCAEVARVTIGHVWIQGGC